MFRTFLRTRQAQRLSLPPVRPSNVIRAQRPVPGGRRKRDNRVLPSSAPGNRTPLPGKIPRGLGAPRGAQARRRGWRGVNRGRGPINNRRDRMTTCSARQAGSPPTIPLAAGTSARIPTVALHPGLPRRPILKLARGKKPELRGKPS